MNWSNGWDDLENDNFFNPKPVKIKSNKPKNGVSSFGGKKDYRRKQRKFKEKEREWLLDETDY